MQKRNKDYSNMYYFIVIWPHFTLFNEADLSQDKRYSDIIIGHFCTKAYLVGTIWN